MKMWVFRLPTGPGGDPNGGACDVNKLNASEIALGEKNSEVHCHTNYDNCLDFTLDELFTFGNLRQGWGIPTLDLRLPEDVWLVKYIIAAKKYWSVEVGCEAARGRRDILAHMLNMNKGDIIFLPKISKNGESKSHFTVATVYDPYFFEDRSQEDIKDFAHTIKVSSVKTFPYPIDDISDGIFGAPFMRAVEPVEEHYAHNVHSRLLGFINKHYQ
ncbi:hypothetical protein HMY34_17380 [Thiothrix subterranea]|uniref:hypothetical protein n=1 Tax=Thiothrix subterranea TaxID=2735563 RepID=UPI00192B8B5C|nr:hypothetical protein [Thiothrix subterranea]QQZ30385.1 hypothetical protein HMY34_17380 [Thiothrix subterranea]